MICVRAEHLQKYLEDKSKLEKIILQIKPADQVFLQELFDKCYPKEIFKQQSQPDIVWEG